MLFGADDEELEARPRRFTNIVSKAHNAMPATILYWQFEMVNFYFGASLSKAMVKSHVNRDV